MNIIIVIFFLIFGVRSKIEKRGRLPPDDAGIRRPFFRHGSGQKLHFCFPVTKRYRDSAGSRLAEEKKSI